MATREAAKAQRRRDIVHAARALIRETGQAGFSMRALADAAGVSIATPYNLFGSKQAIMFAVLDDDMSAYKRRLKRLKTDEIDVFLQAISVATKLYAQEPGFYKTVLFAVYADGGREFRSMFGPPRHAFWKQMVVDAIAAGCLKSDLDSDAFAVTLGHIFFAGILEWVAGELSIEELEARAQFGFALCLLSMAEPPARERLEKKARQLQGRLRKIWKAQHLESRARDGSRARTKSDPASVTVNGR